MIPKELKFRDKYPIYSKTPDNPSNILWANVEKGTISKCSRVFLSFIVILLILLVAMVFNLLLQSFNTQYKKTNAFNTEVCKDTYTDEEMKTLFDKHKDYVNNFELIEEQKQNLTDDNYEVVNNCYCSQYNYFEILSDQEHKYEYCEKILITFITTISVSIATGVFISIINFVLVIIISHLINWIHFKSLSTQIAVQIVYITIALFINTIVSVTRWSSSSCITRNSSNSSKSLTNTISSIKLFIMT